MIKVALADSNELILMGLRVLMQSQKQFEVVGEAKCAEDLFGLIEQFQVDVVVMDYTARNFDIEHIPKLLQKSKKIRIVAITPEQSAQTLVHALRGGVTSYIKKDCDSTEIIDAVRETGAGNQFFCGQILETIRKSEINVDDIDIHDFTCEPVTISDREREIIILIAEGLTNAEIAERLFLSNHTINTHRKNILSKLGVKNTAGIVLYAVKANLVQPNRFLYSID